MNRGKTALKRGVAVASAAAIAIAGAVLAAPAASAAAPAAVTADSARAIPTADAVWMNSDGSVRSTADTTAGVVYGLSSPVVATDHANGVAPNLTIGKNGQAVSGLQVLLPTTAGGAPQWSAGDTLTVTLTGGTTGGGTPNVTLAGGATATLSAKPLAATSDLTKLAGTSNAAAHQSGVSLQTGGTALANTSAVAKRDSTSANVLDISLPAPGSATGTAQSAYLLTITGLSVNIAAVNSTSESNVPVVADIEGDVSAGTTTVGYINGVNIATSGSASETSTNVTLPGIVLAETTPASFGSSPMAISVSGTPNSGSALTYDATNQKVSGTSKLSALSATDTADGFAVAFTEAASTAAQSLVVTGLSVGNVKPGTDLTVTVTTPTASADNGSATSFVADQSEGASTTVSPTSAQPRIAGDNRYDTAAQIAEKLGATDAVILANGENATQGVDALSANYLAAVTEAPILLTQANTLPAETKDALTTLFKDSTANITVYVMGTVGSVSQAVRDAAVAAIKATSVSALATVTVKEVSGSDRYATSAATVDTAGASSIGAFNLGKGSLDTAFLASGQVNADALAASAVSAGLDIPVLLTTSGAALPASVQKVITDDGIGQVIILGSTDRVSQAVEDALTKAGVNVVRLAGTDRYDTAVKIASLALKAQPDGLGGGVANAPLYIANGGAGFPDALAVGPLAGHQGATLVTVSDGASLPGSTAVFLAGQKGANTLGSVDGLGGTDRVTDSVITQATALLGLS